MRPALAPSPSASRPELISVIMPVLNEEAHIGEQLTALASQTYEGRWELVVVDNGCTDGTMEIVRRREAELPSLRIVDARARRGLNYARNSGARAAAGDFLVFCDGDNVADPGWLEAMAAAAASADLLGGRNTWERLNDPEVLAWRPAEPMTELNRGHEFLPYASGGNLGVWASIAREIGWDERFTYGSSDQVFAWKVQLAGYRLRFVPEAVMETRWRPSMRGMAHQYYLYGKSAALVHRVFRGAGIPKPDNREAMRQWRALLLGLSDLWTSRVRRGNWVRRAAFRCGRLAGSVRARTLVL